MTEREGAGVSEELVYRISTMEEWELMQKTGSTFGGDLDRTTGFIHLSKLDQVQSTLLNFFLNVKDDLYLLQIDAKKIWYEGYNRMIDACPMEIVPGVLALEGLCLCAIILTYYLNPKLCGTLNGIDDVISICFICLLCSFVSFTSFLLVGDAEKICNFDS
ncbi:uncharacterized protein [Solanum lycopersicum]|uniref:Uncharacterized protein LOC107021313 isoform X2 n=1 Tax=Solanum pennellii TaxID=28526 RepID=A0ABM1VDU3_SOLPN|nr:uncharacterized protein LOC101244090 isoform X1 [Solanum lycopersicum]XP_027773911.1 uncharacterized protein LOC107021313 isoform X2 [Solanum pennellii]